MVSSSLLLTRSIMTFPPADDVDPADEAHLAWTVVTRLCSHWYCFGGIRRLQPGYQSGLLPLSDNLWVNNYLMSFFFTLFSPNRYFSLFFGWKMVTSRNFWSRRPQKYLAIVNTYFFYLSLLSSNLIRTIPKLCLFLLEIIMRFISSSVPIGNRQSALSSLWE